MRAGGAGALALLVAGAVSASALAAAPKKQPATTYVDKAGGYAITIPSSWKLVPRTVAQVKALVAEDRKKKATVDLADAYASIVATAAGRTQVTTYRFQAFDWPGAFGMSPILTQVYVGRVKASKTISKGQLPAIGAQYANALASNKGSKIVTPKTVDLPAGPAEYIVGTIPAGQGVSSGFELYLIPHGKVLFELGFQIDASLLSQAKLFGTIAHLFKFA